VTVRRAAPALIALVLAASSCGDDDSNRNLLPANRAEDIRTELDTIAERVERGQCEDLAPAFERLGEDIQRLPNSVDRRLRQRLAEGFQNLQEIAPEDCERNEPETTTTETVPPETTPETVPPETTPETVPPETTPETVPPETTPEPPPETVPPEVPPEDSGGQEAP
jgi:hypothetical protein